MEKDFTGWNTLKEELHELHAAPSFHEREVWWCSVGINVGFESDGKNEFYNRPVLVIRKFNHRFFLGVPLTTQHKQGNPYYCPLQFRGKTSSVLLSQVRSFDAKRLTHKMGRLPKDQFGHVQTALAEMINPTLQN